MALSKGFITAYRKAKEKYPDEIVFPPGGRQAALHRAFSIGYWMRMQRLPLKSVGSN